MTDTRDIRDDLDEVSADVLADLDNLDRIKLTIEAMVSGNEEHVEKLERTAERKTYEMPDMLYQEGVRQAMILSLFATYELDRGMLWFHIQRLEGLYETQLAYSHDVSDWDNVEEPSEANEAHELAAKKAAAKFYRDYLAWDRVAQECFEVDLPTFLAISTPEKKVEMIEDMAHRAAGTGPYEIDLDGEMADGTPKREVFDPDEFGWAEDKTVEEGGRELSQREAADVKANEIMNDWFGDDWIGAGETARSFGT